MTKRYSGQLRENLVEDNSHDVHEIFNLQNKMRALELARDIDRFNGLASTSEDYSKVDDRHGWNKNSQGADNTALFTTQNTICEPNENVDIINSTPTRSESKSRNYKPVTIQLQIEQLKEKFDKSNEILEQRLKDQLNEIQALKNDRLRSEREKVMVNELQEQVTQLRNQNFQIQQDCQAKNEQLEKIKESLQYKEVMLEKSKAEVEELKSLNHELSWNKDKKEEELHNLQSVIAGVTLFGVVLGKIILEYIESNDSNNSFDSFIKISNPEIIRFHVNNDETKLSDLSVKVATKEEEIDRLSKIVAAEKDNANQLKVQLNKTKEAQEKAQLLVSDDLKEGIEVRKELEKCTQSLNDLASQHEKEICKLMNELLVKQDEITTLKRDFFQKQEEMRTEILVQEQRRMKQETELMDKEVELDRLRIEVAQLTSEYQELRVKFERCVGDPNDELSYTELREKYSMINIKMFNDLGLDDMENLTLMELRNILKQCVILLNIPYNKLLARIPLIHLTLNQERRALEHFTNKVHYTIHGTTIAWKKFRDDAYYEFVKQKYPAKLHHKIEDCLDNLYSAFRDHYILDAQKLKLDVR